MTEYVIDADGHIMEDHKDLFAHLKGNFSEINWHSTWPMLTMPTAGSVACRAKANARTRSRGVKFVSE